MKKITKNITIKQIQLDEQEVQAVRTTRNLIPQLEEVYCEQFEDCRDGPLADPYDQCLAKLITTSMGYILSYDADVKEDELRCK